MPTPRRICLARWVCGMYRGRRIHKVPPPANLACRCAPATWRAWRCSTCVAASGMAASWYRASGSPGCLRPRCLWAGGCAPRPPVVVHAGARGVHGRGVPPANPAGDAPARYCGSVYQAQALGLCAPDGFAGSRGQNSFCRFNQRCQPGRYFCCGMNASFSLQLRGCPPPPIAGHHRRAVRSGLR